MSDLAKLKQKAAELEQRRQFDKALAVYEEMLLAQEGSDEPDVSLLNRVGDLRVRLGRGAEALDAYERAVELYVERGFLNNAIALCNKILRQDPARAEVHYRLGRISAEKGFRSDARRHFLDYAGHMQRSGRLDEAFGALNEFAELSPENADVRLVLAEQLARHGRTEEAIAQLSLLLERYEAERRYGEAEEVAERIRALDPDFAAPVHPEGEAAPDGGYRPGTTPSRPHTPSRPGNGMPELVLIEPTEFGSASPGDPSARRPDESTPSVASEALIRDDALELANDLQAGPGILDDQAADREGDAPAATDVVVALVDGLTANGAPAADDATDPAPGIELAPMVDGFEATGADTQEGDAAEGLALADHALEIEPTALEGTILEIPDLDAGAAGEGDALATADGPLVSIGFEPIELGSDDADADAAADVDGAREPGGADAYSADGYTVADFGISLPDGSDDAAAADLASADDSSTADASSTVEIPYLIDEGGADGGGPAAATPAREPAAEPAREERAAFPASSLPSFLSFDDEPTAAGDDSFINLGDLLRAEEGPRSTRMVTEEKAPTGDEQADFAEMLRKFKQGVAENVDEEDYESHHDLGVAYREMGLIDEAIAEFQRALRGTPHRARTYEALGQCFLDREQYAVATSVLQRALAEPGADDQKLVGVLYLLGRAAEAMNQRNEALSYYQRVFAVDIEFADVAKRMDMAIQVAR